MTYNIKKELLENKLYIISNLSISFLTFLPQYIASMPYSKKHIIFLFLSMLTIYLLSNISRAVYIIFIFFINITNAIIGHIFIHWGYFNIDIGPRIEVFLISPKYEILEYLRNYIDIKDIFLIVYIFLILFYTLYFLIKNRLNAYFLKKISLIFFIVLLFLTIATNAIFHLKSEPFSIIKKYILANKNSKIYNHRNIFLSKLKQSPTLKNHYYDKIIIIQGESVNKNHMSIYGYKNATTPFLNSLKLENKLYIFNAISPSNQTLHSTAMFYTKANVKNFINAFINSESIITKLKLQGYYTFWISNQGKVGKHDTAITSIANEANVKYFENLNYSKAKTDFSLINYLKNIPINNKKELYIFHLIGSHTEYKFRHDNNNVLYKDTNSIIQQYDNSIYYTDLILREIFNYFLTNYKQEKILFIYFSDHGEVVNEKFYGHGFLPPYKDEYEIPLVIYSNIKNDRIEKLYDKNKKGLFNLENFNYILEYITYITNYDNLSYSESVIAVDSKNIFEYSKLKNTK